MENKNKNKILILINLILITVLIIDFYQLKNVIPIQHNDWLLTWDILGIEYVGATEKEVKMKLGNPNSTRQLLVGEKPLIEVWNGLHRFQKHRKDTLIFKELHYKQDEMDFYLWLLPDRDSTWRVVDGVKYNPKDVSISMYSIVHP